MKVLKYPLIPIVVFLALGILTDYHFTPERVIILVSAALSLACFIASFVYSQRSFVQRPYFIIATCLMAFSSGMAIHWLHYAPNNPSHYSHFLSGKDVPVIKGIISERLKPDNYNEKYYFKIIAVGKNAASGKILLSSPIDSLHKKFHAGQIIIFTDKVRPIPRPLNPYQFDYSEYMAKQNVFHQIRLKENFVVAGTERNFDYYIDLLRRNLINSFDIHEYKPQVKNIINALLLGQRQDMDKATTDNYTNAGVIHILAISGLHFATLFYILNLAFRPLSRIHKSGRIWQLILILGILWTFAFITGLSASVVRSVVMFSFISIGRYFNRNSNIFNSLALSMLVLLVAKPAFLFDVGFQLSYAAVFAIVWLQPLYSRLRASKYKAVNYLTDTVLISLVAQLGVLPLSIYYFNQFPLLFLLANIVVIPLSTAVLLLGLIVLGLNFVVPSLAVIIGKVLACAIILMNGFIEWIASFDSLVLKDIPFTLLLNVALYVLMILLVRWLYSKTYIRTISVVAAVILFQVLYSVTAFRAQAGEELIVFHNRKATILATKTTGQIAVYSTDSLAAQIAHVREYSKENFNDSLSVMPLQNLVWFNNTRILVIDSLAVIPKIASPDILVLTQSPKINLERVIKQLKPKQVIADGTNFTTHVVRWQATCAQAGIPFHATNKKGFYRIN